MFERGVSMATACKKWSRKKRERISAYCKLLYYFSSRASFLVLRWAKLIKNCAYAWLAGSARQSSVLPFHGCLSGSLSILPLASVVIHSRMLCARILIYSCLRTSSGIILVTSGQAAVCCTSARPACLKQDSMSKDLTWTRATHVDCIYI